MRAVSPLGREVVCHIKSPFLLLLQLHSKHGDRGRDCAWQHYSQASRKIAVLLPISVTVIQVQPALCDAWYVYRPRGLLKQSGLSLLCCSFLFCHLFSFMLPGWFKHALGEFFFLFLKVMGDIEGLDNASSTVSCPAQSSDKQWEDKGGDALQLRKRKKRFWRECLSLLFLSL